MTCSTNRIFISKTTIQRGSAIAGAQVSRVGRNHVTSPVEPPVAGDSEGPEKIMSPLARAFAVLAMVAAVRAKTFVLKAEKCNTVQSEQHSDVVRLSCFFLFLGFYDDDDGDMQF